MSIKQKMRRVKGNPSNMNLSLFVFSFDVCQASWPGLWSKENYKEPKATYHEVLQST